MSTRKADRYTARCPGCGLFVVVDDRARELRHESPICATFQTKMAEFGMKPRAEPWLDVVAPDGSIKKRGDA